jgi:hypothetical protein
MNYTAARLLPFVAIAVWLTTLDAPLFDGMAVKQIFVAHKARAIAGPPFDLTNSSFAILDDDGKRLQLTEEVPVYTGLLAAGYRLFGEHDWVGRLLSVLFSILALVAFRDLVARTADGVIADVATGLLTICPVFLFYGRAVQPDSAMLALMLVTACCYDRHLERGGRPWLVATAIAGMLAALVKYYGLMVLIPLAFASARRRGPRGFVAPELFALAGIMIAPVAIWIAAVFVPTHNPAQDKVYFLFQMPELLWQPTLYARLFDRFLFKDCGPVTTLLFAVGVSVAIVRRDRPRAFDGWAVMGLVFYFALGPLLRYHDYYELMLLPAATVWAAWGLRAIAERSRAWSWLAAGLLVVAAVVQGPWLMGSRFANDRGHVVLAERLRELCPTDGRVAVFGPDAVAGTVHYSHRDGWAFHMPPEEGPTIFERLQRQGALYAAVYYSPWLKPADREPLMKLIAARPVVVHANEPGAWEYYILDLR